MRSQESQINSTSAAHLLQLRRGGDSLGIAEASWRQALVRAAPDPIVGIRHAEIQGDKDYRIHVAAIPQQVGCHFHRKGNEDYSVVEGKGILHFGLVTNDPSGPTVRPQDWRQLQVSAGDSFVIPEGYAHQLGRTGTGDLTILFGCPDSHLNDSIDRTILPNAPE